MSPEEDLITFLAEQYPIVRRLGDGSIAAICPLMFTTSILMGCDRWGYSKRFCFEKKAKAISELEKLKTEDDEPTGYIARR